MNDFTPLDFKRKWRQALSRNESEEAYFRLIYGNCNWRVIECRDGLQWILQRRQKTYRRDAWRSINYCRTRKALTRLWRTKSGDYRGAEELSKMLPERIGGADA